MLIKIGGILISLWKGFNKETKFIFTLLYISI